MGHMLDSTKVSGINIKPTSGDTAFEIIVDFDNGRQHSANFNRRQGKHNLIDAFRLLAVSIEEDRELN